MDQAVVKTVKTAMHDHVIPNKMTDGGEMIQERHPVRNPIDRFFCLGQILLYVWKINQSSANNYHHILTKTLKWE